jgi:hypothetical protein
MIELNDLFNGTIIPYEQENDVILSLKKLDGKTNESKRVIVLAYKSVEILNKKKYLKIIGIDVYSGTTVLIVDTNSMKYGLHSYEDAFISLKPYSVIKAPFKYVESDEYANVLRITGIFELLGFSNIEMLKIKYDSLGYISFIKHFNELDDFYNINKHNKYDQIFKSSINNGETQYVNNKKELYTFVRFSGTKLDIHNGKYQLKIGSHFANINKDIEVSKYLNHWYIGPVLLSCKKNQSGSLNITALKLLGRFYSDDEYKELKCKRNSRSIKNNVNDELYNYINDSEEQEEAYGLRHDRSFRYYELYDENEPYNNSDYILDGCDEAYFSEWEDEYPEYTHDANDDRSFNEPIDDYEDEYVNEELETEYLAMLKDMYPELGEEELKSLFAVSKEHQEYEELINVNQPISLLYLTSNNKYEIEDILDDKFSINFKKARAITDKKQMKSFPTSKSFDLIHEENNDIPF